MGWGDFPEVGSHPDFHYLRKEKMAGQEKNLLVLKEATRWVKEKHIVLTWIPS
jgi:hypothetical protein